MKSILSKILFWSPFHGQGQTSNVHTTGLIMSLLHKKKILMMQTHFSRNNLESPLIGNNVSINSDNLNGMFVDVGLDVAVTYSNMNALNKEKLESCCFSFEDIPILLMPGTEIKKS